MLALVCRILLPKLQRSDGLSRSSRSLLARADLQAKLFRFRALDPLLCGSDKISLEGFAVVFRGGVESERCISHLVLLLRR